MTKKPETQKPETNLNTSAVGVNNTELPATVKIKFNKNVRYNRTSYVKDDVVEVPATDYEQMTEHCEIIESAE